MNSPKTKNNLPVIPSNMGGDLHHLECIEPGQDLDQRDKIDYFITMLKNAPNPSNAAKFLDFIRSDRARNIYKKYGFVPHLA